MHSEEIWNSQTGWSHPHMLESGGSKVQSLEMRRRRRNGSKGPKEKGYIAVPALVHATSFAEAKEVPVTITV
eukprot:1153645-Pelagomonas_calceolata.AAC.1